MLGSGIPVATSPTTATPLAGRSSTVDRTIPTTSATSAPGILGRDALAGRRSPISVADPERRPCTASTSSSSSAIATSFSMIVPLTDGMPSSAGIWPTVMTNGEPDDEAGHDRRREELRQEAEARGAGDDQDRPDRERQAGAERRRTSPGSCDAAMAPTTDADMIAIDELAVTFRWRDVPKIAYAVEGRERGDQPKLGRDPGQARVGHRDRDHDAPADDARRWHRSAGPPGRRRGASGRSGRSGRQARAPSGGPSGPAVARGPPRHSWPPS